MLHPAVAIVVLNWNNAQDTLTCLTSLAYLDYSNYRALVVDNGSTDDSIERIKAEFPNIPILEIGANLGYTGGNNAGIRWALANGASWVFLLNNDTILATDALSQMIAVGQTDPMIGILGPTIYHAATPNVIQSAGGLLDARWRARHRGQNQLDQGQFSQPTPVDWVSGCALLVRRKMIKQIGLLDEHFFAYQEELEWCIRARRAQWRIMHVPGAHVWHYGVSKEYRPKPYVTYYMVRNRFLLLTRHKAGFAAWLDALFQTARTLLSWSIRPKWRSQRVHRDAMWRGIMDFLRHCWGPMPSS